MTGIPAPDHYDIVILGKHLTTSLLAAILARSGASVAVVPSDADSIRPAGETTVPYTAELFFLLGSRFDIPEISALGMFRDVPESVRRTSGVKRNLGFLYHREGTAHRPAEALQFAVPAEHSEWHLYRPEVDDYAASLAGQYGATVHQTLSAVDGVRITGDGVSVALADGRVVRGEYLVDGSGDASTLSDGLPGLDTAGTRHHADLLHTHFTDVRPFESIVPLARYQKAKSWAAGTLLHGFPGGWIQVVPFGNHSDGVNTKCSVTVSLDPQRYPVGGSSADAHFSALLSRFPDLQQQFAQARQARPWTLCQDLPARAPRCHGPRWFLFDRSAARHDLLLSRDLTMSLEVLHALAATLVDVVRRRDWTGDTMRTPARFQLDLFDYHDRFVAAGRIATTAFPLWNAYLRTWLLWSILSALSLKRARMDAEAGTTADRWSSVEHFDQAEFWYQVPAGLSGLLDAALADFEAVGQGADPEAMAARICDRLRRAPFVPPLFNFGDLDSRYYDFTRLRRLRMLLWVKTTAPRDFRRLLTPDNVTAAPATHHA